MTDDWSDTHPRHRRCGGIARLNTGDGHPTHTVGEIAKFGKAQRPTASPFGTNAGTQNFQCNTAFPSFHPATDGDKVLRYRYRLVPPPALSHPLASTADAQGMEDGLPVFPPRICLVVVTKGTPRSVLQGAPSFLTFLNVRSSPEGKAVTDPLHSFHFAAPSPLSAWTTFEYDHCSHCRGCEILDLQLAIPLLFLLRPPTSPPSSSRPPAHDPNRRPTPWLSASSRSRPSSSSLLPPSPRSARLVSLDKRQILPRKILPTLPVTQAPHSPNRVAFPSHHAARHTINLAALSGCVLSFRELSRAPLELPPPPPPGSRARHAVLQPLQHGDRETLVQSL